LQRRVKTNRKNTNVRFGVAGSRREGLKKTFLLMIPISNSKIVFSEKPAFPDGPGFFILPFQAHPGRIRQCRFVSLLNYFGYLENPTSFVLPGVSLPPHNDFSLYKLNNSWCGGRAFFQFPNLASFT
jgi:hypothetical protein